jgi:Uma2 family endonuclease
MAHAIEPSPRSWTAVDLVERFGAIPLCRVRQKPAPGTASEQDVVEINDREDRLCELVDGVLVEKTVGTYESYLAVLLARLIGNFTTDNDLGIVLGADGMMRLAPGLIRIPDVSFISWTRLPERKIPREAVWNLAPDLAIEVISKGNTPEEMKRKLEDYFAAGAAEVWYVDHALREIHVYGSVERREVLHEEQTLDSSEVLPGFRLALREVFADPGGKVES